LPTPAPKARASSHLSDSEVSFCGDVLTFARTHFARAERVVAMSAIENGKKNITISQLERLAQALGVSADKLLK
jgi:transcriptional regulator with XRE-family HTH domain